MSEKKLTPEQAKALSAKLMMKYKSSIEEINIKIQRDIELFGHVSLGTNQAKNELEAKIMKEKEVYQ